MLFVRFTRFLIVGGFSTLIQYLILVLLVQWAGVNAVLASSIGFLVSAFANYYLNYHFTFCSSNQHGTALIKFIILASIGLALNAFIMQVLVSIGIYYLLAQVLATGLVLIWNFVGNSKWTFLQQCR